MTQPLISVIIPVYNGRRYLDLCLQSVTGQTYRNIEVIIVDDGSTDGSGAVCDGYAADSRVTVIHKANEGQAVARNIALAQATGELVSFIDCDDWLEPQMYETMTADMSAAGADVAICGYWEEFTSHGKPVNGDGSTAVYSGSEALRLLLQGKIGSYLWTMLFRRNVIQEPMMVLRRYEDHATIFKWVSHAGKVVCHHQPLYHYRQLQGSSLHSYDDSSNDFFTAISERYHYVADHRLLPGWEAENRRLYLRGCLKITKDLVRKPVFTPAMRGHVCQVRDEIKAFLPITRREIGTKYYIRMKLLFYSIDVYRSILRATSLLSLHNKKHNKDLFGK